MMLVRNIIENVAFVLKLVSNHDKWIFYKDNDLQTHRAKAVDHLILIQ